MLKLRPAQVSDLEALYAISLATGAAGADAADLYEDRALVGHIYSAPYLCLEPDLALVLEDECGVAGFAVGVLDTETWESRLEAEWWPHLRRKYTDPTGPRSNWTPDQKRCAMIHHPERTPTVVARDHPAHLHLNLLPRLQGRGLGSVLLHAWLGRARDRGAQCLHVGVSRLNTRALKFWSQSGFCTLDSEIEATRTVWLGRRAILA